MKERLDAMEKRLKEAETTNINLEKKISMLEDRVAVTENVSTRLSQELDRLDQYHRRSNIVIKNVFLPEKESPLVVNATVTKILTTELQLPDSVNEIDKLHRVGKIRTKNGKSHQDIIVRFKTHSARYAVYKEREKAKSGKLSANLTKTRGELLYKASKLVEENDKVEFCFPNTHGDLYVRLKEPIENKVLHPFFSLEELQKILLNL